MRPVNAFILILWLGLYGLSTARAQDTGPAAWAARAKAAEAHVVQTYQPFGPGATYLISHRGKTLVSGGVGSANLEWDIPLSEGTMLRLGSISKPLTAVAVLQLAEKDQLSLDVAVGAYAPDLPPQMAAVTLRQLLSHRSGLAEHVWNPEILPFIWQPMTTEKIIELQKDFPADFAPGTQYKYVNFNYVLVAHIIEKVTGVSFIEFANNQIFGANGMHRSAHEQLEVITKGRAEFYELDGDTVKNTLAVDLSHVSAAGALIASAEDMGLWTNLLMGGKLIREETLAEAWQAAALPDGTATKYGMGFNLGEVAGARLLWHNGLTPGGQAAMGIAPDQGLFVIVMSNAFNLPSTTTAMREMMTIMISGEPTISTE